MAVARRLQELSVRWRSDAQLYSYDRYQVRILVRFMIKPFELTQYQLLQCLTSCPRHLLKAFDLKMYSLLISVMDITYCRLPAFIVFCSASWYGMTMRMSYE
jgi:hypothetical protein